MTVTTAMLPEQFADLEPFAAKWSLQWEADRYATRLASSMDELQALYDHVLPRSEEAMAYLDQFDLYDLSPQQSNLMWLLMSVIIVAFPVEAFRQAKVPDTASTYLTKTIDPGP